MLVGALVCGVFVLFCCLCVNSTVLTVRRDFWVFFFRFVRQFSNSRKLLCIVINCCYKPASAKIDLFVVLWSFNFSSQSLYTSISIVYFNHSLSVDRVCSNIGLNIRYDTSESRDWISIINKLLRPTRAFFVDTFVELHKPDGHWLMINGFEFQ